jgi:hypothetical protein
MRNIRYVGAALAAVTMLVMSVGPSSAFGFSEFKLAAGEKFPVPFVGGGGAAKLESPAGNAVRCEKSKSNGAVVNAGEAKDTIEYSGKCELKGVIIAGVCKEPITTKELTVEPGEIVGGTERGWLFTPAKGAVIVQAECGGLVIPVEGKLVCESRGKFVKKLAFNGEMVCEQAAAGVQKLTEIEVKAKKLIKQELTANALFLKEKLAQTTTEILEFKKEVEQT